MPIPINIDPTQQPRLWKRGLSLDDAWWRFGSQEQRERHNSVQPTKATKSLDPESFSALSQAEQIKATIASVGEAFRPILDQSRVANEMRRRLIELLRKEKLVGYGYHSPRRAPDHPVRIPNDLFNMDFVDWTKSEIEGNGSKYFAVKIFKTSWLKELPVARAVRTSVIKRVGRPPMKTLIGDTRSYLKASNSITESEPQKSIAVKIQEHIRSGNVNNASPTTVPSMKTILKYLGKAKAHGSP